MPAFHGRAQRPPHSSLFALNKPIQSKRNLPHSSILPHFPPPPPPEPAQPAECMSVCTCHLRLRSTVYIFSEIGSSCVLGIHTHDPWCACASATTLDPLVILRSVEAGTCHKGTHRQPARHLHSPLTVPESTYIGPGMEYVSVCYLFTHKHACMHVCVWCMLKSGADFVNKLQACNENILIPGPKRRRQPSGRHD